MIQMLMSSRGKYWETSWKLYIYTIYCNESFEWAMESHVLPFSYWFKHPFFIYLFKHYSSAFSGLWAEGGSLTQDWGGSSYWVLHRGYTSCCLESGKTNQKHCVNIFFKLWSLLYKIFWFILNNSSIQSDKVKVFVLYTT